METINKSLYALDHIVSISLYVYSLYYFELLANGKLFER